VLVTDTVWLAEVEGTLAGYAAASRGWLNHLYVDPERHERGVGSTLLAAAVPACGEEIRLWTFQRNVQARRFYERNGFTLEQLTDGASNEEREPDALHRRGAADAASSP
jgi:GNAT superfamily N-acetyltransferase